MWPARAKNVAPDSENTACAVAGSMTPASDTAMIPLLIIAETLLEPVDFAFLDIIVLLHEFI